MFSLGTHLALCLKYESAFDHQEKSLVGVFSVIIKPSRFFVRSSSSHADEADTDPGQKLDPGQIKKVVFHVSRNTEHRALIHSLWYWSIEIKLCLNKWCTDKLYQKCPCSAHAEHCAGLMGGGGHTDWWKCNWSRVQCSSVDDKIIWAGTSSGFVMPGGLIRSPQYYPPSTLPCTLLTTTNLYLSGSWHHSSKWEYVF